MLTATDRGVRFYIPDIGECHWPSFPGECAFHIIECNDAGTGRWLTVRCVDAGPVLVSDWCAHRFDETLDLPACASRGRFVGGVWRSAC